MHRPAIVRKKRSDDAQLIYGKGAVRYILLIPTHHGGNHLFQVVPRRLLGVERHVLRDHVAQDGDARENRSRPQRGGHPGVRVCVFFVVATNRRGGSGGKGEQAGKRGTQEDGGKEAVLLLLER